MKVMEAIKRRRAIKGFDATHSLTQEELRTLLTAIALAPTSFNMQNRHTVAVVDSGTKEQLQGAAWGQEHVRDASVVFVLTGDMDAHNRTDRYLRNAPPAIREQFEAMIPKFYDGKSELLRDEACRSVGLAAMNLMLTAQAMGYESCPMIGFDPQKVAEILGLDDKHPPLMLVTVGKGTKAPHSRLGVLSFQELVSIDRFGNHAVEGDVEA